MTFWWQKRCRLQFYFMGRGRQQDEESEQYSEEQREEQKVQIRRPKIERIDKFKTLKRIVINVSMTQYPVVTEVAEQLNWKVQTSNDAGDWDVYWTDFSIDPDILIKMHLFQKINHYPGIHVIARKNLLGMSLMNLRNHFPDEYNFFPLTWMLPMQYAEFRGYFESKPRGKARTYIVKPEADCQGRGIFLTRKMQDLQNGKHYVVQRYLARPYLLQGLKFDLRIYVLLCGSNPMRLYMYDEGLARLATEQYVQPTSANLDHQYMHLTNYAINKNSPKFVFNNSAGNMGVGHKRSLSCVFRQLGARGLDIEQLKNKINDVAIKTIICGLPLMSHQYRCSQPEDYSGSMCFHILGLDIMLNAKGQPVLLQVNHTPSFTTDTPLDQKIKFGLIKDTLTLMNINVLTKQELMNRAKELNQTRLLTGKRQIFEGKERQEMLAQAQRLRDQYQDKNLGGFKKIFPVKDENVMNKYNNIIQTAQKIYAEQNGSIRMKMMQKEAKKLMREDFKQRKSQKTEQKAKGKTIQVQREQNSEPAGDTASFGFSKNNFSSEHYLPGNETSLQRQSSICNSQLVTKSQNVIDLNSEMVALDLVKKYSDLNGEQRQKSDSMIKIKKIQASDIVRKEIQSKQSRLSEQTKLTPQNTRKNYSKQPIPGRNIPSYMYQNVNFTPGKIQRNKTNIANKNLSRRINSKAAKDPQLPNIIDNIILANNDMSSLLRRQEKLLSLQKGINININAKNQNKSRRIYDHIAKDIKDMIERKNGTSGGYVMPKLINLSIENQRRATEQPSNSVVYRKANPSISGQQCEQ